jgi:hypothetical protein
MDRRGHVGVYLSALGHWVVICMSFCPRESKQITVSLRWTVEDTLNSFLIT